MLHKFYLSLHKKSNPIDRFYQTHHKNNEKPDGMCLLIKVIKSLTKDMNDSADFSETEVQSY